MTLLLRLKYKDGETIRVSQGAHTMAIKGWGEGPRGEQVFTYLPPETVKRLREMAQANKTSISGEVRRIVLKSLKGKRGCAAKS